MRSLPNSQTFITLQTYRDGVVVSPRLVSTASTLFASRFYECDGNETVLRDCSQNSEQCVSGLRTFLTCKGRLSFFLLSVLDNIFVTIKVLKQLILLYVSVISF